MGAKTDTDPMGAPMRARTTQRLQVAAPPSAVRAEDGAEEAKAEAPPPTRGNITQPLPVLHTQVGGPLPEGSTRLESGEHPTLPVLAAPAEPAVPAEAAAGAPPSPETGDLSLSAIPSDVSAIRPRPPGAGREGTPLEKRQAREILAGLRNVEPPPRAHPEAGLALYVEPRAAPAKNKTAAPEPATVVRPSVIEPPLRKASSPAGAADTSTPPPTIAPAPKSPPSTTVHTRPLRSAASRRTRTIAMTAAGAVLALVLAFALLGRRGPAQSSATVGTAVPLDTATAPAPSALSGAEQAAPPTAPEAVPVPQPEPSTASRPSSPPAHDASRTVPESQTARPRERKPANVETAPGAPSASSAIPLSPPRAATSTYEGNSL